MDKQALRKEIREKKRAMTEQQIVSASERLGELFLASEAYKGGADLETIEERFVEFGKTIIQRYGRVDYVYCEDNDYVTTKAIKNAVQEHELECTVRNSAQMAETDRIRLTTKLMKQGRFFLTDACETLSRAFSTAVWTNKRNVDKRDEMSDIGTLKAFECTIEREATRLLQEVQKEGNE